MGWYDAFGGDTNKASSNLIKANSTNGMKAFGDAFSSIGKAMSEDEMNTKKKKLIDSQIKENEQKNTDGELLNKAKTFKTKAEFDTDKTTQQGKYDDAFNTEKKEYDDRFWTKPFVNEPVKQTVGNATADGQAKIDKHFQDKFNSEAQAIALNGKYKNYNEYVKANPELVTGTLPEVGLKIKKMFDDGQVKPTSDQKNFKAIQDDPKFKEYMTKKKDNDDKPKQLSAATIASNNKFLDKELEKEIPFIELDEKQQTTYDLINSPEYAEENLTQEMKDDIKGINKTKALNKQIRLDNQKIVIKNTFIKGKTKDYMEEEKLSYSEAKAKAKKAFKDTLIELNKVQPVKEKTIIKQEDNNAKEKKDSVPSFGKSALVPSPI